MARPRKPDQPVDLIIQVVRTLDTEMRKKPPRGTPVDAKTALDWSKQRLSAAKVALFAIATQYRRMEKIGKIGDKETDDLVNEMQDDAVLTESVGDTVADELGEKVNDAAKAALKELRDPLDPKQIAMARARLRMKQMRDDQKKLFDARKLEAANGTHAAGEGATGSTGGVEVKAAEGSGGGPAATA